MVKEVANGIYTFDIILPDNPLKWLNCYVIKGRDGGRNLLIDSGFRMKECLDCLKSGMKELELRPENTDVFFTHLHSDHTGNANYLESIGCRLMINKTDYDLLFADDCAEWYRAAKGYGISGAVLDRMVNNNPGIIYSPDPFKAEYIEAGDILCYGGRKLECVLTPGHTPGHMCLLDKENKLIFTGDHVLFDISPNIVAFGGGEDALGTYIDSLVKIKSFDIDTALPAHRSCGDKTVYERVDELIAHHSVRLREVINAVTRHPGSSAYELAQHVSWHIRSKGWDDFPDGQKWFAVSECMAHIVHLLNLNYLIRHTDGEGVLRFYPVAGKKYISYGP